MQNAQDEISVQLRQRLTALLDQVMRDRQSLNRPLSCGISPDTLKQGDAAYARLFDSLQNTLHNLDYVPADEITPAS